VQPKPSARYVVAHAEQGFTSNVPLSFLRDEHALLRRTRTASRWNSSTAGRSASDPGQVLEECEVAPRVELRPPTSRASGSGTATTTTPTRSGRALRVLDAGEGPDGAWRGC
jgi:hypothetical protein